MTSDIAACDVVDDMLNRTGVALLSGDFDSFVARFILPQSIETFEGRQPVKTPDDLRRMFSSVRAYHREKGIDRLVRSCRSAEFKGEDTIEGVFDALLFRGPLLVQSVHSSFVILERRDEFWQIAYTMYGVAQDTGFGDALVRVPTASNAPLHVEPDLQLRTG